MYYLQEIVVCHRMTKVQAKDMIIQRSDSKLNELSLRSLFIVIESAIEGKLWLALIKKLRNLRGALKRTRVSRVKRVPPRFASRFSRKKSVLFV